MQAGSLAEGREKAAPVTERREVSPQRGHLFPTGLTPQKYLFPNAYLAENSKPPQFWVKQINCCLSIREDAFTRVRTCGGEAHAWKMMQSLTWEILASHTCVALKCRASCSQQPWGRPGCQRRDFRKGSSVWLKQQL